MTWPVWVAGGVLAYLLFVTFVVVPLCRAARVDDDPVVAPTPPRDDRVARLERQLERELELERVA